MKITETVRRRKTAAFTLAEPAVMSRRGSEAFTLAELLVVCGVIVLALGIVVPSLHGLFNARTDREAEGTFGAMLTFARGTAIQRQGYALLHGQPGINGEYWVAVFNQNPATGLFVLAEGTRPQQIAGHMGFGEVSDRFVNDSDYRTTVQTHWEDFQTFNIIFASDGSLTTTVDGVAPRFDTNHVIFNGAPKVRVWDAGPSGLYRMSRA